MKKITLIMLIAIAAMSAKAYTYYDGIEIGNFRYNLALATSSSEESKATLQGLSSAGASVTSLKIPGYVTYDGNRYRVANIATNAFQYKTSVASVELGYGVQKIGNNVFKGCDALKTILLPSSITEIGNYAFQSCTALLFVRVAGDVAPAIQDNTFDNSGTSKRVSTATYRGMNALKADSKWVAAFGADNIKRQSGIVTYDFVAGNLYYVIKNGIPYNGTSSDPSKRSTCVIVGADFSSNTTLTINNQASNSDNNAPGQYRVYGVADSAFRNNSAVTEVKCNYNQASRIGIAAFQYCSNLTSVEVTADTIGNSAFYGCSNLTSASLYKEGTGGVEYLGSYAFGLCGMTTVDIPATTKYIGYAPFYYSPSLTSISVNDNNTNYCSYKDALYNKAKTQLYQIPCKWQYGQNGSNQQDNIEDFPETLQRVLQYAATGCNFKYLYLPYNLKIIDAYAFQSNQSLNVVHFPSSLTTVASNAFNGCDAINRVELNLETPPAIDYFPAVTDKSKVNLCMPYGSYDAYANSSIWSQYNRQTGTFDHRLCWDIKYYDVCFTVTSTSPYSYNGVTGDGTLKVVRINTYTDGYVTNQVYIVPIYYAGKNYVPDRIGSYTVRGNLKTDIFTVGGGTSITQIEDNAFYGANITNFPFNNVETIGEGAFENTSYLTAQLVDFQRLKTIGSYAFYASKITRFVAPTTLTSIGAAAFANCSMLHEMFLPHIDGKNNIICYQNFIAYNASDFKLWVDYRRLSEYLGYGDVVYPHLFLDSEWQSFACVKAINFQNITGLDAYTVSDYNQSTKKATLSKVSNLASKNGAVVHGNVGTYYRLDYATSGSTSSWMEGVTGAAQGVNSNSTTSYFMLNANEPQFDKITSNTTFNRGYAYLKVPTSQTGGVSTIYTNLSEGSETIPGDVNGDGKVNVSDVSTLINMILGLSPMDEARADVNGDTRVNVSDVTALINIILGIS